MKRFCSLLLALILCMALAVPTLAANSDDGYEIIPLPEWTNGFGHHYFHNGLAPVLTSNGWRYVNTEGELVNYTHTYIFDFSDGYAAFADFVDDDFTLKVGYMDAAGKVIVPAQYDLYESGFGEVAVGRVIDGQAVVYNAANDSWEQINMKGQKVKLTLDPSADNVLYSDTMGNTDGVTYETVTIDGEEVELGFSEGYALHYEYIVKKGAAETEGSKDPVFTDVSEKAYYYNPVMWAVGKGITNGTTTTTFSPDNTCTNAHIIAFMWRAAGSPEPTIASPFTNLAGNEYYAKAAVWAYEKGMVTGSVFEAGKACTRAMTMEYFWKQAGSPKTAVTDKFTDVPADASYAQAVAWAVANNITLGVTESTFVPDRTCTRAQIVTYLYRALVEAQG